MRYKLMLLTSKGSVKWMESDDFAAALGALPEAYSEGSTRDGDMV
jgi:hypothetical protein